MTATVMPASKRLLLRLLFVALQTAGLFLLINGYVAGKASIVVASAALFACTIGIVGTGYLRTAALISWMIVSIPLSAVMLFWADRSTNWGSGIDHLIYLLFEIGNLGFLLFTCHVFVLAAESDRRIIARYTSYVREAWPLATLLLLSAIVAVLLWIFALGGLVLFSNSFRLAADAAGILLPLSGLVLVATLHAAERWPTLVEWLQRRLQIALAMLLPVTVAALFLVLGQAAIRDAAQLWHVDDVLGWPFTSTFLLILLINAQFGDGGPESRAFRILAWARIAAVFLLLFIVGCLIALEVSDYRNKGWTPYGITNVATLAILGFYALGYAVTAIINGTRMSGLPVVNVASALATTAVTLVMTIPPLDADHLAISYQLGRLKRDEIAPDKFDYDMLFFDAGTEGMEALKTLALSHGSTREDDIARRAKETLSSAAQRRRARQVISAKPHR